MCRFHTALSLRITESSLSLSFFRSIALSWVAWFLSQHGKPSDSSLPAKPIHLFPPHVTHPSDDCGFSLVQNKHCINATWWVLDFGIQGCTGGGRMVATQLFRILKFTLELLWILNFTLDYNAFSLHHHAWIMLVMHVWILPSLKPQHFGVWRVLSVDSFKQTANSDRLSLFNYVYSYEKLHVAVFQ